MNLFVEGFSLQANVNRVRLPNIIEQIGKLRKRGLREKFDHLLDPSFGTEGSEGQGD